MGLRIHYTGTSFTAHIEERVAAALSAAHAQIRDVRKLSVGTAVRLFELKLLPMLSYGLGRVWKHLTTSNFAALERCFCTYMKRVLCLHRTAKNSFIYLLAEYPLAVEVMRVSLNAPVTDTFQSFRAEWEVKVAAAATEVLQLDVFLRTPVRRYVL